MPEYIIAYRGGRKPATQEEGSRHMAKWKAWVADLGAAAINPGTPLKNTRIVSATGVSEDSGPDPMSGFTIVSADSMDAALEIARACPTLELDGTLEVAEMMQMP